METFSDYLEKIENEQNRERMAELFAWIEERFPGLKQKIAWNQPMFTDHGTYIIGFSTAKNHMSVAPESAGIRKFSEEILGAGYTHGSQLFRIPWNSPVNYDLLEQIIRFNIKDKSECTSFWRKS